MVGAAVKAWTLSADDIYGDDDVIDSDTVLDADDLKKPDPASLTGRYMSVSV